jgi:hypothetical protein
MGSGRKIKMIKDLIKNALTHLNNYKVGWGTAIGTVAVLMWGSYELGTRGWEQLNVKFVDHAEAEEYVTWTAMEIREKNQSIRQMDDKIVEYKIKVAENPANDQVKTEVDAAIIKLESNIEKEKEAIECLKSEEQHTCDF